jgi:hypothetical protein
MKIHAFLATSLLFATVPLLLPACASSDEDPAPCVVDPQSGCDSGLACENTENGATACFAPVFVEGIVTSRADGKAIGGVHVLARDVNGMVGSRGIGISALDGWYSVAIPAVRKTDGTPTLAALTLRANAGGFAAFPSGLRIALPIDVTTPTKATDGSYVVKNAGTNLALDPLPSTAGLGSVSGSVQGTNVTDTLVVVGGANGLVAPDGSFVVFNVPVGAQEVRGYAQGLNFKPANVKVVEAQETKNVLLEADGAATATVSGDVQIVNPSAGSASATSVVLVVKSTFAEAIARGEMPLGLRQANVSGAFAIPGVPNGTYVVLAAFENDGLVRDPDITIGGTAIQEVTVIGASITAGSFKVTGALDVRSPGATGPETIASATPTFTWADDSSEDGYELRVYDGFGNQVWELLTIASVNGDKDVNATYAGPTLAPGYYQFRAASFREKSGKKTYISTTEDLKGVFKL